MITLAILTVLGWVLHGILSIIPVIGVPDWLANPSGPIATVFQAAGSMGVWFPVALIATILAALLVITLASFGIKAARMVVSLFTGGGGSAA